MSVKNAPWEGYFPPFKIFGNLYFVGTTPASTHVVDTGDGLIMFDSGYQQSLYLVIDNMYSMGLNPHDLKYIFMTHRHIDHFGATRALVELTGAKTVLGEKDYYYATGRYDLSFAKELDMQYNEVFKPDIKINDGDEITLGNTTVKAVATPGHTEGAMSYFFDVTDGEETFRAGLHGGMGTNTLTKEFLTAYDLPISLRDDYVKSMNRLAEEKVDIFLGNHMQHNNTPENAKKVIGGDKYAFVYKDAWKNYCLWCIDHIHEKFGNEVK